MSAIQWQTIKAAIARWVRLGAGLQQSQVLWNFQGAQRPSGLWINLGVQTVVQPAHDYLRQENNPLVFADVDVTSVDVPGNRLVRVGHGLVTGDGPVRFETDDTLPAPLDPMIDYWVVAPDDDHIQIADSFTHTGGNNVALGLGLVPNPITLVTLTDAGVGSVSVVHTADTVRAGREIKRTAAGIREINVQMQAFGQDDSGTQPVEALTDVIASLPLYAYDLDLAGVGMSSIGVSDVEQAIKSVEGKRGGILEPRAILVVSAYVSSEVVGYIGRVDRVQVSLHPTLENGDEDSLEPFWVPSPP